MTALGVVSAMHACASRRLGARDLRGVRVSLALGHVGTGVAELLAEEGAILLVSDIDERRREPMERFGAAWILQRTQC